MLLIPRQLGSIDFPTALKNTQAAFNSALAHHLPLQYLTGQLMGDGFLQQNAVWVPI